MQPGTRLIFVIAAASLVGLAILLAEGAGDTLAGERFAREAPPSEPSAPSSLRANVPLTTATPTPDAEFLILQYVVNNYSSWTCQGPYGGAGHRYITDCNPYGNFSHPTRGSIDRYGSPGEARAIWEGYHANACATYPICLDRYYMGYRGYEAGNTSYPYAHYETYFHADIWVVGAISVDDTHFRGAPLVAGAILDAALTLGYLGPATPTPVSTSTPTPVQPTATPTPCSLLYTGSIGPDSWPQQGRLIVEGSATNCGVSRPCPGVADNEIRRNNVYFFGNTSPSPQCVQVHVSAPSCYGKLWSASYLGAFYPQFICTNYLADTGNIILAFQTYSFTVPGNSQFAVVVSMAFPNDTCGSYTVSVGTYGGCYLVGPTPSPTPTIVTPTTTRTFTPAPGLTTSPTATNTIMPTSTATGIATHTATPHFSPTTTQTPLPSCTAVFADVPPGSTFYPFVRCLACRGIVSGYPCGGAGEPCDPEQHPYYRPGAGVTRGQLAKVVVLAMGWQGSYGVEPFADVPIGSTFHPYIVRLYTLGYIQGYPCGGPGEPCDPDQRPYFRPGAGASRGQISKIVAQAAGINDPVPTGQQTFEDVPPGSTFWLWIEQLAAPQRGVVGGYSCGNPEPCVPPLNRPYFRPSSPTTRGQIAKIVAKAFFPGCQAH